MTISWSIPAAVAGKFPLVAAMHEPNPFRDKTLTLIESRPSAPPMLGELRGLAIRPDRDDLGARPRLDQINALLARIPAPEQIELLEVDYHSNLTALPALARFPNLRYAHVAGRKIKSYEGLHALRRIQSLFLVAYKEQDLSRFSSQQLLYLRLIRGSVSRIDRNAKSALLQNCSHLTELSEVRMESLMIEACNRLELETLPRVSGLRKLSLIAQRNIPALDWIGRCPSLQSLVITANPLTHADLSALCTSRHLKVAFLGSVSKARILQIAEQNPGLVVTNGDICFHDRRPVDVEEYYAEDERLRIAQEPKPAKPGDDP
jgi:hypothetical protein